MPLTPWCPHKPLTPHPVRHLVVKSGTTSGQHNISSACGSGWCFVRYNPTPSPLCPLMPPGRGIWWLRMVLALVPLTWAHVLLSVVFNRPSQVFKSTCNGLSWFFRCYPHALYTLCLPPWCPQPPPQNRHLVVKEWYYCRSAWYVVSLMFGQIRCTPSPTPW